MKTQLRPLILAILVSFSGAVVFGQNPASFSGPRAYLGNNAVIGDFTGDGILDMATIDQKTSNIHIHAGLGNGKFAGDELFEINTAGTGAVNFFMATADLNGDGLADLVVGIRSSKGKYLIQPLLRNPTGGFRPAAIFAPTTVFVSFSLADVTRDGRPDLVVVGTAQYGVLVGNGNGTFQPEIQAFSQTLHDPTLAIGDFNGDGNPDLAIPVDNGIFILFGDGTGRFPTGTTFTTTEEFGPIAAADLNKDGKQDLIVESLPRGVVEVLLGDGGGGFGLPQVYFVAPVGAYPTGLAIGDVNGDGILDIVTTDPAVLIGKGDGTFEAAAVFPGNFSWQTLQLADLRGIGQLDIVADLVFTINDAHAANSTVLLNTGTGKYQDGENILVNDAEGVAVADFDGDGHDDVAVTVDYGVEILRGTGRANPALQPSSFISLADSAFPFSGDFNNDGIPDLLVEEGSGAVAYLAGLGNGLFAPAVLTPASFLFNTPVLIGDFNGDGKLDIAGVSGSVIEVFIGNGAGGFSLWTSFPKPAGLYTPVSWRYEWGWSDRPGVMYQLRPRRAQPNLGLLK